MKKWILFFWLSLRFANAIAQIGGEMDYRYLGGFSYRITMKLIVKMDSSCNDIDPTVKINMPNLRTFSFFKKPKIFQNEAMPRGEWVAGAA